MRERFVFSITFILLTIVFLPHLHAATVSHDELASALEAKFPVSKSGSGAVVFTVQRTGLLGFAGLVVPENKVEEGKVDHSRLALNTNAVDLAVGTLVYISKLEAKNDTVKIHIATVDKFNSEFGGLQTKTRYKAVLAFKFAKDYLNKAPVEQVAQQISAFLVRDNSGPAGGPPTGGGGNSAPPPSPTPPPPPASAPAESFAPVAPPPPPAADNAGPPATIKVGQTPDQVIAILGQPTKISDVPGKKKLYEYPDLKITFSNGRVTDVR